MRTLSIALALLALTAVPSFAQSERGYVGGSGGFTGTSDVTTANVLVEGGVHVLPHLSAFGNLGQFHDLSPADLEPVADPTIVREPAVYSTGGVRYQPANKGRWLPYVLGGVGVAHLTPTAHTNGIGSDATSALVSALDLTSSNAFMLSLGGGLEIPMAHHWAADAGYRYSRLETDTPLNTQGATFGLGYRF